MKMIFLKKQGTLLLFAFLLSVCFLFLFSYSTSPLYRFEGYDSSIFKILGAGILHGKVLYRDLFDHKGPLLFFIESFGYQLTGSKNGIFLLQCLNLTLCIFFMIKTIQLFDVKWINVAFSLFVGFIFLSSVFQEGNQCEEWELLFVVLPIYLVCRDKILHLNHPPVYSLIYGICIGSILCIRMNDIVIPVGLLLSILFVCLFKERQGMLVLKNISLFCLGCLIVFLPFFIYFLSNNALDEAVYGIFTHNFRYATEGTFLLLPQLKFRMAMLFGPIVALFLIYKKDKVLSYYFGISVVLFSLSVGKSLFPHYSIVLFPFYVLLGGLLYKLSLFVLTFIYLIPTCVNVLLLYRENRNHEEELVRLYKDFDTINSTIGQCELVWNLNCVHDALQFFPYTKRLPKNRVFIYTHVNKSRVLQDTELDKFISLKPRFVFCTTEFGFGNENKHYFNKIGNVLNKNYHKVYESKDKWNLVLYELDNCKTD